MPDPHGKSPAPIVPLLPPKPRRSNADAVTQATETPVPERTGLQRREVLRVGRYEVNERIAAGGMATVHLGRLFGAAGFARLVAIKRLLPQFTCDPEFETMFVEEAHLAARIQHPNVVSTLDVVASDGELLLVMEYVHGESLARLMSAAKKQGEEVPQPIALAIVCDALHGLHAAHEARDRKGKPLGIVHRDISPQNIIVGADGVARVLDFGIAKAADSIHTTRAGLIRGKAAYMAPEQLFSGEISRRTDLYAMGVILWELLVGDRLFPGGTRPELVKKAEGIIPRPRERQPRVPRTLDDVVMKALATSVSKRFVDAREMAARLESQFPIANRAEIAAWVQRLAENNLTRLETLTARVESSTFSNPPPSLQLVPDEDEAPEPLVLTEDASVTIEHQRKLVRVLAGVAGGALVLAAIAVGALAMQGGDPDVQAPEPTAQGERSAVEASEHRQAAAQESPVQKTSSDEKASRTQVPSPTLPPAAVIDLDAENKADAPTAQEEPETEEPEAKEPPSKKPALAVTKPKAPPQKKPRRTRSKKSTKPDCNPPYTIDSAGRKRFKAACF